MGKIFKKGKLVVLLLLIVVIAIIGINLLLIIKINVSESKVEKMCFSNHYFVESDNEEMKIEIFKEYMVKYDWKYIENYRGVIIFRKGNLQKEVPIKALIKIWVFKNKR